MEPIVGIEPTPGAKLKNPPEDKECCVCLDKVATDSIYRPCIHCTKAWCATCLRDAFLAATIDESQIPCACCINLPVCRVRELLTPAEITLYKAKREERNDPRRIYCPIPTCSTYIPRKIYVHLLEKENIGKVEGGDADEGDRKPGILSGRSSDTKAAEKYPLVSCLECAVEICLSCKQLSHQGESCKEEPASLKEIEKALEGCTVKQCPKCHILTERVYGCVIVQCRCGVYWCWGCGNTRLECPTACHCHEATDREPDSAKAQKDAADQNVSPGPEDDAGTSDGYHWNREAHEYDEEEAPSLVHRDVDSGSSVLCLPEPDSFNNLWSCEHSWYFIDPEETHLCNAEANEEFECEHCGRAIFLGRAEVSEYDDHYYDFGTEVSPSLFLCCERCGTMACPECCREMGNGYPLVDYT